MLPDRKRRCEKTESIFAGNGWDTLFIFSGIGDKALPGLQRSCREAFSFYDKKPVVNDRNHLNTLLCGII